MNGSNNERKRNLVPNSLTLTREATKYYPARGDPSPQPRSAWPEHPWNAHLPKQKLSKATQTNQEALMCVCHPEIKVTEKNYPQQKEWKNPMLIQPKCGEPILIEELPSYHSLSKSSLLPIPTSPTSSSKKHVTFSKTT